MKKVFHFDAPREPYRCDAAVVWCFDHRFDLSLRKFLKWIGVIHFDLVKVAGGAKCLASPDRESEREFILDQIRKSIRLHETRRVILMVHSDCGAYGGLKSFGEDALVEARHHRGELQSACQIVRAAFPGVQVDGYYVDFEGVWEPDVSAAEA